MKISAKILSLVVASVLIVSSPLTGNAKSNNGKGNDKGNNVKEKIKQEKLIEDKQEQKKEKNINNNNEWKEAKDKLQLIKDEVEQQKDELESQKDELEKQYEEAKASENNELTEQLKAQIQEIETKRIELKNEMKSTQIQIKEVIKNRYSLEELEKLQEVAKELEAATNQEGEEIVLIPVENINVKNKDIKFDTPPVIKQGRTLIPVRAITQGFGATLEWNQEDQKITIVKDDIEIILQIDSNIAIVNGEEVEIDAPSSIYSNRTYVPLRFISETFGLDVEYDEETGLTEIEDKEAN